VEDLAAEKILDGSIKSGDAVTGAAEEGKLLLQTAARPRTANAGCQS
jgi:hypothetical protein